jgi:hypothetical protein
MPALDKMGRPIMSHEEAQLAGHDPSPGQMCGMCSQEERSPTDCKRVKHHSICPVPVSLAVPSPTFLPTTSKFVVQSLQARQPATKDCDPTRLHEYLSDTDFFQVFGMSLADFSKMPKWKQNDATKKQGLFWGKFESINITTTKIRVSLHLVECYF